MHSCSLLLSIILGLSMLLSSMSSLLGVILVLVTAVSASSTPTSSFPDIPFLEFSSFITNNFGSHISLATVLILLSSLMENPELLNLHGRQQHSNTQGESEYLLSSWMKIFSRLLLDKRLRAVRSELFRPEDHIHLIVTEEYNTRAVNSLSKKLDGLASVLGFNTFNTKGKLRHRRREVSTKEIEPLRLILPQSYECNAEGCHPYSLTQNTKYTHVPKVSLIRGSDTVEAWVLHGLCSGCKTSYYADHTRFRGSDEEEWQRSILSSARFVKLGQSTWSNRTFTSSVLNATYSFHASSSAFAEFWTTSFGVQTGTDLTRCHVWQAVSDC